MEIRNNFQHQMKSFSRAVLFVLLASLCATAANVRGRLDRVLPNGARYPATGVAVTVYNQTLGRSNPSTAGLDGLYYINNIPAGSYYLEVWANPGGQPMVFPIQVFEPYVDIPPIVVP
ncbi:MAG: carboxypeptidase-like regulatory domain-containing protein [Candidatus Sulfotelmatobacter sp.]